MANTKEDTFRPKKERVIKREEIDFYSENKSDAIYSWSIYNLNPDQQEIIKKNREESDLLTLTRLAFNDNTLTQYTTEFRNVKRYYSKLYRNDKNEAKSRATGLVPLSDAQIDYIWNNAFCFKPQEITYQLFPDRLDESDFIRRASQTVGWLIIAFDLEYLGPNPDILEESDKYIPPTHETDVVIRIRNATGNSTIQAGKLDRHQKDCVKSLKQWLSSSRFMAMMNNNKTKELRKIFEDQFIAAVYDKPDLTPQDVNGFMSLCSEYANQLSLENQVDVFEKLAVNAATGEGEDKKFDKNILDSLKSARDQLDRCKDNQHRLRVDLGGSLSKRKEEDARYSSSFAEMVLAVRDKNQRAKLLAAAEAHNRGKLKDEIDKVTNHPQDIAEVFGVNINEILGFTQEII